MLGVEKDLSNPKLCKPRMWAYAHARDIATFDVQSQTAKELNMADQGIVKVPQNEVLGRYIPTLISQLIYRARTQGVTLEFVLNDDIVLRVSGTSDASLIYKKYCDALKLDTPTKEIIGP